MKIKEFKKEITDIGAKYNLDLEVTENNFDFYIKSGTRPLASVSKSTTYLVIAGYAMYEKLEERLRRDLLSVMYELASTPIDEREDEKKFYLKHRFLEIDGCNYLNYDYGFQDLNLNDKIQFDEIQTQFTQKKIEEIKEKYNTDLKDFEIIEVEE